MKLMFDSRFKLIVLAALLVAAVLGHGGHGGDGWAGH